MRIAIRSNHLLYKRYKLEKADMPVNKLPIDDVVDKIKKLLPEDMLHVREEITRNI